MKTQTRSGLRPVQSLGVVFVMFFAMAFACRDTKRASADFNPYKGKLSELLKPEMSSGLIKFKLAGTANASSYVGATEATAFTYTQEGGGVSVKVDGGLANYPSASQAEAKLADVAKRGNATLTKKNNGQRLTLPDGRTIAWTNGSLFCIVTSGFAKPASNFESSASF